MKKLHLISTNSRKEELPWPVQSVSSVGCGLTSRQFRHKPQRSAMNSARTSVDHNSSTIVAESNSFLRCRLGEAEESVTYMVSKLKQLEQQLAEAKELNEEKDVVIRDLTAKLESITKKYRLCKKSELENQQTVETARRKIQENGDSEAIRQQYWEELRRTQDTVAQLKKENSRLAEENNDLNEMLQSAKLELYRLTEVLVQTNGKLKDIAKESDKPTKTACGRCGCLPIDKKSPAFQTIVIQQEAHQYSPNRLLEKTDSQQSKPTIKPRKQSFKEETPPTMLFNAQSHYSLDSAVSINNLLSDWKSDANTAGLPFSSTNDSP